MIIHADNDVTDLSCHKRQKSPGTEGQEYQSLVVYICSNSWLLAVQSGDLFKSKKEVTLAKPEQIYKTIIILTPNAKLCREFSFGS